ncbi:MAG: TSUP family transporter [Planctomycetota bacterium]|jgi:uncharacterized membrane protein YfcA
MLAQLPHAWWLFVLLGVGAGILSSSLGLGGGTVVVPVLVLLCHFGQKSAQGMALAVMVPMAFVGVVRYWRLGIEMNWVVIALMVAGSLAGAIVGSELASRIPAHRLRQAFALFLVVVAFKMFTAKPRSEAPNADGGTVNSESLNSISNGDISDGT